MLTINEIFFSIQGESTHAGKPCIFIRLTGCHLRCTYCDTEYAFYKGEKMSIQDIFQEIQKYQCQLVEITGGEPLLQEGVNDLMKSLLEAGYTVLLETSGAVSLEKVPTEVIKIMDLKTPSSNMSTHNLWGNLEYLNTQDEIKFVIGDRNDYDWAKSAIQNHQLLGHCKTILMSPTHGVIHPGLLGKWITEDALPVKLQVQLHKYLEMR